MEKILRHIERLFIRNDYVIIPGLGGFVLQEQSAQITRQGIIPPYHTVGFNARMNSNDGLLATEVLRAESISYRSALTLIETEVAEVKKKLQSGNKVQIGRLGWLFLNAEKQIIYKPADTKDMIPCNFGLNTLYIAPRSKEKETTEITFSLPSTRNVFRYAASILIIMAVLIFTPRIGDSTVSDFAGLNSPLSLFELPQTDKKTQPEAPSEGEITEAAPAPQKRYHIVVSCLSNKTSAERYCELLQAKHYDNARVLPSVKTNRIIIESFSEKEMAALYLNNLRKSNKEFKDAWLYREPMQN